MSDNRFIPNIPLTLDGPNLYHLYIGGGHITDVPFLEQVGSRLNEYGICSHKYNLKKPNESIIDNISDGILNSQKCLIYISNSYDNDKQSYNYILFELSEINKKIDLFSTNCVLVLKSKELDHSLIPQELKGLTINEIDVSNVDDECIKSIKKFVTKEYNPWLSVMSKNSIGYTIAFSYFYGFLNIILPKFRRRFNQSIGNNVKSSSKLMIIISESCFSPFDIVYEDKLTNVFNIEDKQDDENSRKHFVHMTGNRAGTFRDYKSTIYEITCSESKEKYYCALELCTPLLTLYETFKSQLTLMTEEQMYYERNNFYFFLDAILNHPSNMNCHNQYRILYWRNKSNNETEENYPKSLYEFMLPILKEEVRIPYNTDIDVFESDNIQNLGNTFQIEKSIEYR